MYDCSKKKILHNTRKALNPFLQMGKTWNAFTFYVNKTKNKTY